MKTNYWILGFIASLCSLNLQAAPTAFNIMPNSKGESGLVFSIGYTAGNHDGTVTNVSGTSSIELNPFTLFQTEISIPLSGLSTDNSKRDCHMREALGLDYLKTSVHYPSNHICGSSNTLPTEGGDSIASPTIKFSFLSLSPSSEDSLNLMLGNPVTLVTNGSLELHGVTKFVNIPLTFQMTSTSDALVKSLSVKGDFEIILADYNVVVMPFLFIKVKDRANVSLNLNLVEVK